METAKRGCVPMRLLDAGIGTVSKSVNRRAQNVMSTRMLALGHLGVVFGTAFYGNEMTWDQFAALWLKHGDYTQIEYDKLREGWKYEYDAYGGRFLVTDAKGSVTVKKAETLSEMGIVWDILCSGQFRFFYAGTFINDAFLVAWHRRKWNQYGPIEDWEDNLMLLRPYFSAYIDQYYSADAYHWRMRRFAAAAAADVRLANDLTQGLRPYKLSFTTLRNTSFRPVKGDYTEKAIVRDAEGAAAAKKRRGALKNHIWGEFLLIALFASVSGRAKPVIEPRMLWEIWKWLGMSRPIETRDKIFDLSPNWG